MTGSLNLHPFYNEKQKRWTRLVIKHEKMGSGRVRKGSFQQVIALSFFCQLCVNSLPGGEKTTNKKTRVYNRRNHGLKKG